MIGSVLSIRYKGSAAVIGGSIIDTPPAGSKSLNVVCFAAVVFVVLLVPVADFVVLVVEEESLFSSLF